MDTLEYGARLQRPGWPCYIRKKSICGYVRRADQYQTVAGRKVLTRHETLPQAIEAAEKMAKG